MNLEADSDDPRSYLQSLALTWIFFMVLACISAVGILIGRVYLFMYRCCCSLSDFETYTKCTGYGCGAECAYYAVIIFGLGLGASLGQKFGNEKFDDDILATLNATRGIAMLGGALCSSADNMITKGWEAREALLALNTTLNRVGDTEIMQADIQYISD